MQRNEERIGLLFAGASILNGALIPAIAKLTTGRADPLFVAAATIVIAGICATAFLAARGELGELTHPRNRLLLMLAGTLGTAAANLLFFIGASRASAIETVLCLQVEPVYALLVAWLFLGHSPGARRLSATALILAGILLAVGAPGVSASPGVWWLLATPVCWQASHLVVLRRLTGVKPSVLTAARYVHGGWQLTLVWLIFGRASEWHVLTDASNLAGFVPALLFQGAVLSYLGTLVWYQALIRLDLARTTAIVVPSVPLLSLVASFLILGEVPSWQQWLGLLFTAAGVLIFVTSPHIVPNESELGPSV